MAGIDIRMDGCWRMVLGTGALGSERQSSFTFSVTAYGWMDGGLGTGALGVASVNLLTCLMSRHMGGWMDMRGAPRHGFEQRVANNGGAK